MIQQKEIILDRYKRGFHLITHIIEKELHNFSGNGLLNVFIKHTSAGLMLNENADPSVRVDFENILNRMIPENEDYYTHIFEGSDDMPSHVKSALTGSSVTIPITDGQLNLGTWQGIYLCEFRNRGGNRKLVITIYS
ncbi:MAG: secondary thiamine-phosphate synthase enzyme YjbQ [Bacteroidales bacterium]|nr:secondary thiamine-phosphate synthase enzyme YjbQ [Bacteroidales bacterium]